MKQVTKKVTIDILDITHDKYITLINQVLKYLDDSKDP